jgi:hypothetical protein
MNLKSAISAINEKGILLTFPLAGKKEPLSLWRHFYPRSEMRWEWDDNGDSRVADLWHLRMELSRSGKVVYSKWYQGRATFFSRKLFSALLTHLKSTVNPSLNIQGEAARVLKALEFDSPLSTKELKRSVDLQGRFNESTYSRAMKELWNKLLIVGFGEVDDGAFPSLAVGATKLIFEELWEESKELSTIEALETINRFMPEATAFRKFLDRIQSHKPREVRFFGAEK